MTLRRLTVPTIALAVTAILAACGSDDPEAADTNPGVSTDAPSETAGSGTLNDADVEFSVGMIAHHEQAISMAEIALDPDVGASAAVVDLATRIKGAQDAEVEQMNVWLTSVGEPAPMDTAGHDMSSMDGMMTAEQMDALAELTGSEFDKAWLEAMVDHHEGAISQSVDVLANGSYPEVLALAEQIISAQQGEIVEMEDLLSA